MKNIPYFLPAVYLARGRNRYGNTSATSYLGRGFSLLSYLPRVHERDHVHAKAMKTKDSSLYNHFRSLKNHATEVIKDNKLKY